MTELLQVPFFVSETHRIFAYKLFIISEGGQRIESCYAAARETEMFYCGARLFQVLDLAAKKIRRHPDLITDWEKRPAEFRMGIPLEAGLYSDPGGFNAIWITNGEGRILDNIDPPAAISTLPQGVRQAIRTCIKETTGVDLP